MTPDGPARGMAQQDMPPTLLQSELSSPLCCPQLKSTQALLSPSAPSVSSLDQPREESVRDAVSTGCSAQG